MVGVGKKCCWSCNRLTKILEVPQARFQLPGTTGVIFPWAPPIGTPLYILDALNYDLTDTLLDILRQFVESQIDSSKSNQSSPSYNAYQSQVDEMQEEQMRSEDGVVPPSVWSL